MGAFMEKHFRHLVDGRKEYTEAEVRLIIEGAVLEEREACAKVCENEWSNVAERMYGKECAAAIRARGANHEK